MELTIEELDAAFEGRIMAWNGHYLVLRESFEPFKRFYIYSRRLGHLDSSGQFDGIGLWYFDTVEEAEVELAKLALLEAAQA